MSNSAYPSDRTLDMIGALLNDLPDDAARANAVSMMMVISVNFLRQFESDVFVRGMLDAALADLNKAPDFVYKRPQ